MGRIEILILIAGTIGLLYVSRAALRKPRSHGFYRFFAWETILVLLLFNVSGWFSDPFAWYQLISWLLLTASIVPVIWGTILLKSSGRPVGNRPAAPDLLAFEKTSCLVTHGIYRTIRHPLYSSLLLLAWGIFFKAPGWLGGILACIASILLYLTALADEAECIEFFGPPYQEYMKTTKRFIPFIF